ncbi:AAA family ATPase [Stenotrophomonas sp. Sa5BUN4]|uniref:AAA family ATPase n=1 Tax=Stenotrophomonas lacuserhaii TaxID=2760084 RepID=A0A8X8K1M2_9GAMM|nr:AAA family ATPase [Stenotrophomonas pennii]MBD7955763.1 AAA family ATPase [Stenotrophomonas pennii]
MLEHVQISGPLARNSGLPEHAISGLERYVVLAGKNGSGKSRILNFVSESLRISDGHSGLDEQQLDAHINHYQTAVDKGQVGLKTMLDEHLSTRHVRQNFRFDAIPGSALKFTPSAGDLVDPAKLTEEAIWASAERLSTSHASDWKKEAVPYIKEIFDRHFNTSHGTIQAEGVRAEDAAKSFSSLDDAIFSFLGQRLMRDGRGRPTLFGRPIANAGLSSGQMVMLQLVTALHAKAQGIGEAILFMDEPETHLHPSVLVDLLQHIEQNAPLVQVWIATHSIPLLSFINSRNSRSIWSVVEGKATRAGRNPMKVISGLLGDEQQVAMLASFLSLPAQIAVNNFSYQCLMPPAVVMTEADDPQLTQIRETLAKISSDAELKIVDYGAGKGRLVDALKEGGRSISYHAFDAYTSDSEECKAAIELYHGSHSGRYFNDVHLMLGELGLGSIDCIVMTNVLHEIEPDQWPGLLGKGSPLFRLLKDDGYLLIVEDQRLPTGERAYSDGFLILDTADLRELFCIPSVGASEDSFYAARAREGRLTAHLVSKNHMACVTAASRNEAVRSVTNHARTKIRSLRNSQHEFTSGLELALWAHQFANGMLMLEQWD